MNAGYGVNALASTPWDVAVGGTEFIMPDPNIYFPPPNYAATGYIPESTWNDYENPYDGRPLAGNGGASINWVKPDWQAGTGVPADGERDLPDVSLLAGDNEAYLTCERDIGLNCATGNGGGIIGTSISTVNWASIQTLVNQKNNLINGAGNPNPTTTNSQPERIHRFTTSLSATPRFPIRMASCWDMQLHPVTTWLQAWGQWM